MDDALDYEVLAASLLASLLMDEDIIQAMERVEKLRNVQMDKAWKRMGGPWMEKIVNEQCMVHQESDFYLASTTRPTTTVVHAGVTSQRVAGLPRQPLCKWRKGAARTTTTRPETQVETETPEEALSYSRTFCQDCLSKISASRRMRVKEVFGIQQADARCWKAPTHQ